MHAEKIKINIKQHYSASREWRVGFKNKPGDGFKTRVINHLKRGQLVSFLENMQGLNNKKILDAGCGNGEYSLALAKKFPMADIYALDFSKKMCELTTKRARVCGVNIKVIQGDIDNIKFPDGYFDVVFSMDTLHHVPNKALKISLTELNRVVTKGGKLIIDFKNKLNPYVYFAHKSASEQYFMTNRTYQEINKFINVLNNNIIITKGVGFPIRFLAPYVTVFSVKK